MFMRLPGQAIAVLAMPAVTAVPAMPAVCAVPAVPGCAQNTPGLCPAWPLCFLFSGLPGNEGDRAANYIVRAARLHPLRAAIAPIAEASVCSGLRARRPLGTA